MYLCGIWGIVSVLRNVKGAERGRSVLDKDTIAACSFYLFIEVSRELELCYVYIVSFVHILWLSMDILLYSNLIFRTNRTCLTSL